MNVGAYLNGTSSHARAPGLFTAPRSTEMLICFLSGILNSTFQQFHPLALMERALKEAGWAWSEEALSTVAADLRREGIDDPNTLQGEMPPHMPSCQCSCFQPSGCQVEDVGGHGGWPPEARNFIAELMRVRVTGLV